MLHSKDCLNISFLKQTLHDRYIKVVFLRVLVDTFHSIAVHYASCLNTDIVSGFAGSQSTDTIEESETPGRTTMLSILLLPLMIINQFYVGSAVCCDWGNVWTFGGNSGTPWALPSTNGANVVGTGIIGGRPNWIWSNGAALTNLWGLPPKIEIS